MTSAFTQLLCGQTDNWYMVEHLWYQTICSYPRFIKMSNDRSRQLPLTISLPHSIVCLNFLLQLIPHVIHTHHGVYFCPRISGAYIQPDHICLRGCVGVQYLCSPETRRVKTCKVDVSKQLGWGAISL